MKFIKDIHYTVNKTITEILLPSINNNDHATFWKKKTQEYIELQKKRVEQYENVMKRFQLTFDADEIFLSPFLSEIVDKAIELEMDAHKKNKQVFYRSISKNLRSGFPFTKYRKNQIPYILSFGSSLFSGFAHDKGTCAIYLLLASWDYDYRKIINRDQINGYTVFIDKSIRDDNPVNILFFIPPVNSISTFYGQEHAFHITTKACYSDKKNIKNYYLYNSIQDLTNRVNKEQLNIILKNEAEFSDLFVKFIKNNAQSFPYSENKLKVTENIDPDYKVYSDSEHESSESESDEQSSEESSEQENKSTSLKRKVSSFDPDESGSETDQEDPFGFNKIKKGKLE